MGNGVDFSQARRIKEHNVSKAQQKSLANNSLVQDSIMSSTYSGDATEIQDYTSKYDMSFLQTNAVNSLKQTTFRPRMHPFNTSTIRKIDDFKRGKVSSKRQALGLKLDN